MQTRGSDNVQELFLALPLIVAKSVQRQKGDVLPLACPESLSQVTLGPSNNQSTLVDVVCWMMHARDSNFLGILVVAPPGFTVDDSRDSTLNSGFPQKRILQVQGPHRRNGQMQERIDQEARFLLVCDSKRDGCG